MDQWIRPVNQSLQAEDLRCEWVTIPFVSRTLPIPPAEPIESTNEFPGRAAILRHLFVHPGAVSIACWLKGLFAGRHQVNRLTSLADRRGAPVSVVISRQHLVAMTW